MTKSALVIGASSGIGAALSERLAERGYRVAMVARRLPELEALRTRCEAKSGSALHRIYSHDVRDHAAVPALFSRIVADLGGLDLVIYAAGRLERVAKDEYDFAKDLPVLDIGLLGAVAWLNEAAKDLAQRGRGSICGISSIAGDRGRRAYPAYHAAKAGLDTYLESLRNRLHPRGVHVCTIKPGFIDTDMTRGMPGLFWLISPDQAARSILAAIDRRRQKAYVPARWALVGLVIRNIPSFLFRRMDL